MPPAQSRRAVVDATAPSWGKRLADDLNSIIAQLSAQVSEAQGTIESQKAEIEDLKTRVTALE